MGKYEEIQEGETTKEQFNQMFSPPKPKQKIVKKTETKQIPKQAQIPKGFKETQLTQEDAEQMQRAEQEVSERQMVEWKEERRPSPETQAEMDYKLLQIDARMSRKKELIDAVAPDGTKRNTSIELEEDYPEIFSEDMVKGNYTEIESACVFGNGTLINAMKSIGQAKDFSFVEASRFNKNQMALMINISRGRRGFSAVLSKTDKHVSEGVVSHVQRAFVEKQEKKWGIF